jgi:adenosine deaminase
LMRPRNPALSDERLREITKAELHVHFEGTLEPEMMFEMAARNGLDFDREDFRTVAENSFLASFLDEGEKRKQIEDLALNFET